MSQMFTTLFSGSLLVVLLCQTVLRRLSFSSSPADLLLTVGLLFCVASILNVWLETGEKEEPEEDPSDQRRKSQKKDPHDTAL